MIRILFIAESTPGKNRQFSNANNLLFRTVKQAFEERYGRFENDDAFLQFFSDTGFGLEHLCEKTITKESEAKRAEARQRCIPSLAERIKKEQPAGLIILMKSISEEVQEAVVQSEADTVKMIRATPYPAISVKHRLDCIAEINAALEEAATAGIIKKDIVR